MREFSFIMSGATEHERWYEAGAASLVGQSTHVRIDGELYPAKCIAAVIQQGRRDVLVTVEYDGPPVSR